MSLYFLIKVKDIFSSVFLVQSKISILTLIKFNINFTVVYKFLWYSILSRINKDILIIIYDINGHVLFKKYNLFNVIL
jgi:hypothetical protein